MKDSFLAASGIAFKNNGFLAGRKTLVFIHGLSGTCSAWEPYEKALENDYNIVSYDLRGHGLSKRYKDYADYELIFFADDLDTLLDHLKIAECTVVAHSMGTSVAVSYLHAYPGKATSVIFLAPNYKQYTLAKTGTRTLLNAFVKLLSLFPFRAPKGRRLEYAKFSYSPDIDMQRIVPEIKNMTLRLYLFCLNHLYQFTHDSLWQDIKIPVTIVHGTKDSFIPYRLSVELSKKISDSKLITLEGANHMLVINNQKEIIEIIRSANA